MVIGSNPTFRAVSATESGHESFGANRRDAIIESVQGDDPG
jgi:hypothetical protein